MSESSIIPREELVLGAKVLKEIADAITSGCVTDVKEIIRLLEAESEIIQEFLSNFGTHIILIEFIHSRLEYFLFLFNHVVEVEFC